MPQEQLVTQPVEPTTTPHDDPGTTAPNDPDTAAAMAAMESEGGGPVESR